MQRHLWCPLLCLLLCLFAQHRFVIAGQSDDEGPPRDYCSGTKTLTAAHGTVTDHRGQGQYLRNTQCRWVLEPEGDVEEIVIEIEKLDLEFWYDYIAVYASTDSLTSSTLVVWFTGHNKPSPTEPPIVINAKTATIVFYSDQLITHTGFRLVYHGVQCEDHCSNNGYCTVNGCVCYGGWTGSNCAIGECTNNCYADKEGGMCIDDQCQCNPGFYGADCSDPYCEALHTIVASAGESGTITDHKLDGDSLHNADCTWDISVASGSDEDLHAITLEFVRFDLEHNFDFVEIFDAREGTSPRHRLGRFTGTLRPPKVISTTGVMVVRFTTDAGISRTGFTANYKVESCAGGCSGRGHCVSDRCHCDLGFTGTHCEQPVCVDDCGESRDHGVCVNGTTCECVPGRFGADCSICSGGDSCDNAYCFSSALAQESGYFTSNVFGEYQPSTTCRWRLNPAEGVDSLVVQFSRFDLEPERAFFRVYTAATPRRLLAEYTSVEDGPGPAPVIVIQPVDVEFQALSGPTREGIHAQWSSHRCNNSCSGHGLCLPNDQCQCDEGWQGADCSISYCVSSVEHGECYGNGECVQQGEQEHCHCNPGYFGVSCSITHCNGLVTLTDPSGEFADHAEGLQYLPSSSCSWLIQPDVDADDFRITLKFTHFRTEDYFDGVLVYDGPNTNSQLLLRHTGSFPPSQPVISSGKSLFVRFLSDAHFPTAMELTGIRTQYFVSEMCASQCNNAGYCVGGECVCFPNARGTDCSEPAASQGTLRPGDSVQGTIRQWEWHFYSFSVSKTPFQAVLQLDRETGDGPASESLHLYVRRASLPTMRNYEAMDHNTVHDTKYVYLRTPTTGKWYIGVEGQALSSTYSLSLNFSCPDEGCGSHGECQGYLCKCDSGWCGVLCDSRDCDDDDDDKTISAVVLLVYFVVFVLVCASILLVGLLLYMRYRKLQKGFSSVGIITAQQPSLASSSGAGPNTFEEDNEVEMEGIDTSVGAGYARFK